VAGKDGARHADKLVKASGLETVGDLLGLYPRRYVAKGSLSDLGELVEGDILSMVGEIVSSQPRSYRDRRTGRTAYRLEVTVRAEDQKLAVTWFDRQKHTADWRAEQLTVGRVGMFSGKLKWWQHAWQLTNPDARLFDDPRHPGADRPMPDLIPIYTEVGAISTWFIEDTIAFALEVVDRIPDVLPEDLRRNADLVDATTAYRWIHRPDDRRQLGAARKRLKYDEAFVTQSALARRRVELEHTTGTPRRGRADGVLDRFDGRLPFTLTGGQRAVGEEIDAELAGDHPMHRLLQGEVGSGKTLVALRAMLRVVDSGAQAALLAPTEVLAQQHHRTITGMLGDLGEAGTLAAAEGATAVALLTGSMGTAARRRAMLDVARGEAGIVIGTHALLEEKVQFFDLGLVVVDEQHRFGVEQRAALTGKSATPPHVLVMTATPIPRTVAMTVFGDLDTSTLTELPAGRGDVQTTVVPTRAQPAWVERAWQRIREEVAAGRQAYVVCARITADDDPEAVDEELPDAPADDEPRGERPPPLFAVEEVAPMLADGPLAGLRVRALHGRMAPEDKDAVMRAFAAGEVDVLVSTTVIEVGVDVPNATVMTILDADRFGVSQLHQLRGRIGRGGHAGLCLLITAADPQGPSMERLVAVAGTRDGFELSRIDLAQRREGDVLGTRQSGGGIHRTLRLLSVLDDEDVIVAARDDALALLRRDPALDGAPDLAAALARLEESGRAEFLEMS
jgi:ATP-dependent DNA helicase RecG